MSIHFVNQIIKEWVQKIHLCFQNLYHFSWNCFVSHMELISVFPFAHFGNGEKFHSITVTKEYLYIAVYNVRPHLCVHYK